MKWAAVATDNPAAVCAVIQAAHTKAKPWAKHSSLAPFKTDLWKALAAAPDEEPLLQLLREVGENMGHEVVQLKRVLVKHMDVFSHVVLKALKQNCPGAWPVNFVRALRLFPDDVLKDIVADIVVRQEHLLTRFLNALPPKVRGSLLANVRERCEVKPSMALVNLLRGKDRYAEARRLIADPDMPSCWVQECRSVLPPGEVFDKLKQMCLVPNENMRQEAAGWMMKNCYQHDNLSAGLQFMVQQMRTERESVRAPAIKYLQKASKKGLLKDEHVPLLEQVLAQCRGSPPDNCDSDCDSRTSWGKISRDIFFHAVNNGQVAHTPLTTLALAMVPELLSSRCSDPHWEENWEVYASRPSRQRDFFMKENLVLGYVFRILGYRCTRRCGDFQKPPKKCKLNTESLAWIWPLIVEPALEGLRARVNHETYDESLEKDEYWRVLLNLARYLALPPNRLLFTSPLLNRLLEDLTDVVRPDTFALVEESRVAGAAGSKAEGQPKLTNTMRFEITQALLGMEETRGGMLDAMRKQPQLLPLLVHGVAPGLRWDCRAKGGSMAARILSSKPHLLVPTLLAAKPDDSSSVLTETEREQWPSELPVPPLNRTTRFTRWTPEQQCAFAEGWLVPMAKVDGKLPPNIEPKMRPLGRAEWALRMLGRLTYCPSTLPTLEAEYERHAAVFLALTQKQKDAAAAAAAAAASGKPYETDLAEEAEDALKLAFAEAMAISALVAMTRGICMPAAALPKLRDVCSKLPGKAGRNAVQSLRHADAFEKGDGSDVVGLLASELPAIGVRKELLLSLKELRRPDLLEGQIAATVKKLPPLETPVAEPQGEETEEEKAVRMKAKAKETAVATAHRDALCMLVNVSAAFLSEHAAAVIDIMAKVGEIAVHHPESFEQRGRFIAEAVFKVASNLLRTPTVSPELQLRCITEVMAPFLVKLPPGPMRVLIRTRVLSEMNSAISECAKDGDAAGITAILGTQATVVITDKTATWAERTEAVRLVARAAWGSTSAVLEVVRAVLAITAEDSTVGARVAKMLQNNFNISDFGLVDACVGAITAAADLLAESKYVELMPVALCLRFRAAPWEDAEKLPAAISAICAGTGPEYKQWIQWCPEEILSKLPTDNTKVRAAIKAAIEVLSRGSLFEKIVACSMLSTVAKMSPKKWEGFPESQLKQLCGDDDLGVRLQARWIAVRENNEVKGEVQGLS
eukprot:NODE_66_length_3871_cov_7.724893.p1 GENE.NODE_66_length_3871_cov_7.724893~~NODE_66_length_3871_cov_7.724893.p1  ORF type:complete len:1203 (-),score=356.74 NODE_66_length_3871_cov_7.724893:262-3870(-)